MVTLEIVIFESGFTVAVKGFPLIYKLIVKNTYNH